MGEKTWQPPSLVKPGIAPQHLADIYTAVSECVEALKIGYILKCFVDNEKSVTKAIRSICSIKGFEDISITSSGTGPAIKEFESSYKSLTKEKEKTCSVGFQKASGSCTFDTSSPMDTEPVPSPIHVDDESAQTSLTVNTPEPVQCRLNSTSRYPPRQNLTPPKLKSKKRADVVTTKMRCTEKMKCKKDAKQLKEELETVQLHKVKYLMQDVKRKKNSMNVKDSKIFLLKREIRELKCKMLRHRYDEEKLRRLQRVRAQRSKRANKDLLVAQMRACKNKVLLCQTA